MRIAVRMVAEQMPGLSLTGRYRQIIGRNNSQRSPLNFIICICLSMR